MSSQRFSSEFKEEAVRQKIEAWRVDYNEFRPHQSLADKTPREFAQEHQQAGYL